MIFNVHSTLNKEIPGTVQKSRRIGDYCSYYNNPLLILTSSEHVPPVNGGIPHGGGVDKHQR